MLHPTMLMMSDQHHRVSTYRDITSVAFLNEANMLHPTMLMMSDQHHIAFKNAMLDDVG